MIAQQRENAENSENVKRAMRTYVNMVCGEPFDPTDETEIPPDWKILFNRREDYTVVPQKASFLTAFADIQRDRIEKLEGLRVLDGNVLVRHDAEHRAGVVAGDGFVSSDLLVLAA